MPVYGHAQMTRLKDNKARMVRVEKVFLLTSPFHSLPMQVVARVLAKVSIRVIRTAMPMTAGTTVMALRLKAQ